MVKVHAMFPMTTLDAVSEPLEYSKLVVTGPPGMQGVLKLQVVDGEVFLADNYAFVRDDGRGHTYVLGLQTVQLGFAHLESPAETIARAVSTLAAATQKTS